MLKNTEKETFSSNKTTKNGVITSWSLRPCGLCRAHVGSGAAE